MSVYYLVQETSILVKGKTYPYREVMRSLGASYNAADKSWLVPNTPVNMQKVGELCKSVGGGLIKETKVSEAGLLGDSMRGGAASDASMNGGGAGAGGAASGAGVRAAMGGGDANAVRGGADEAKANTAPQADGFTIAELMRQAQLAIAQSFPRSVWVIGEIQNIRFHASGVYFQLADSKEGASQSATVTINATLWNSQFRDLERKFGPTLKEILQDGFRVRVLCDLTLFKDRGQLSLHIQSIDPNFTKGSLALAREKLLKELRVKGLDRANKQLRVSPFPFLVGLISAEDSRAKSDFLDQLRVYGFPGEVLFYPSQMQGESTLKDVVSGLNALQAKGCDLIVITRGGGSAADLRWFDSPEIAYAIAAAKIPIVAAIGHHEDVCVAEEICFQREKTPTAAADFIIATFQRTRERLDALALGLDKSLGDRVKLFDAQLLQLMERMRSEALAALSGQSRSLDQTEASLELNWQRRVLGLGARLDQLQTSLQQGLALKIQRENSRFEHYKAGLQQGLTLKLQRETGRLDQFRDGLHNRATLQVERVESRAADLGRELERSIQLSLQQAEQGLLRLEAALKQKDPQPWMQQGWTQLFNEQGLVKSGAGLKAGQELKARLTDGLATLTVKDFQSAPYTGET